MRLGARGVDLIGWSSFCSDALRVAPALDRATLDEWESERDVARRPRSIILSLSLRLCHTQLTARTNASPGMNNPNGGGIIPPPPTTPTPGDVLDPEVEELWSSRALLLVSPSFLSGIYLAGHPSIYYATCHACRPCVVVSPLSAALRLSEVEHPSAQLIALHYTDPFFSLKQNPQI
jgi:ferredoxin